MLLFLRDELFDAAMFSESVRRVQRTFDTNHEGVARGGASARSFVPSSVLVVLTRRQRGMLADAKAA